MRSTARRYILFVTCTHRRRVFALCSTPPHSEEVEQDEDCSEYGDVKYVPPRYRQGAQGGLRPPTPRRPIRARHGRVCERQGESTRGLQVVAGTLARRAQPRREPSVVLPLFTRVRGRGILRSWGR